MSISVLSRYSLSSCVAAIILSSCGGSQPPIGAPGAMQQNPAIAPAYTSANRIASESPDYRVLLSFNGANGADPSALIAVNGTLYGMTQNGGGSCPPNGCGVVYSLSTTGVETVLYSFTNGSEGLYGGSLIDVNGKFYGTRQSGGTHDVGTVFSLSTAGSMHVLYNFGSRSDDGAYPVGLIDVDGKLYGTTGGGGVGNDGTVFRITPCAKPPCPESVLYSFQGGKDGSTPYAPLIDVKGTLYGTTSGGGSNLYSGFGYGTVFSISTSGREKVLRDFDRGSGFYPAGGLLHLKGKLYGTTQRGGAYCGWTGCGIVYSVTLCSKPPCPKVVLHSFGKGNDGVYPEATLISLKGKLYGTTTWPAWGCCGTVFSVTPCAKPPCPESVLHRFAYTTGIYPSGSLVKANDILYGTTSGGGANSQGTVFSLTP